jgi:hypothetical protein
LPLNWTAPSVGKSAIGLEFIGRSTIGNPDIALYPFASIAFTYTVYDLPLALPCTIICVPDTMRPALYGLLCM